MKNVLILHGTDASSKDQWFPWLSEELAKREYHVWLPDLPRADRPSMKRYSSFLLASNSWKFNKETAIIGHSSGAVAILGLLQTLPRSITVDTCVLVGAFKGDLGWNELSELWDIPINFREIKKKAKRFVFLHSDDDPYCPLEHARELSEKLDGELIINKSAKHFAIGVGGPQFKKLPIILDILGEK